MGSDADVAGEVAALGFCAVANPTKVASVRGTTLILQFIMGKSGSAAQFRFLIKARFRSTGCSKVTRNRVKCDPCRTWPNRSIGECASILNPAENQQDDDDEKD
jgi:hypothetical protein